MDAGEVMSAANEGTPQRSWKERLVLLGWLLALGVLLIQPGTAGPRARSPAPTPSGACSAAIVEARLPLGETLKALHAVLARENPATVFAACRPVLHRAELAYGAASLEAAEVLDLMVECAWRSGAAADSQSMELAARALAIKQDQLGNADPRTATSLRNLGILHELSGGAARARELYLQAKEILQRAHGAEDPRAAMLGNDVGIAAARLGRYAEAMSEFRGALAVLEAQPNPEALDIAFVLNGLGVTLYEVGDYAGARSAHERALALRSAQLPPEHPKIGETLNNLGVLLAAMGDEPRAREFFERVLAMRRKTYGESHPLTASAMVNVARLQLKQGDGAEAQENYEGALKILEGKGIGDASLVSCYLGLGSLHEEAADWGGALPAYEKALDIGKKTLGEEHSYVAETLHRLAALHYAAGDLERARSLGQEALSLRRRSLGDDHPDTAHSLVLLATVLAESGDTEAAFQMAAEAETVGREQQELAIRHLAEREALLLAGMRARGLDLMQRLAVAAADDEKTYSAWEGVIRARSMIFEELVERATAAAVSGDAELARLVEEHRRASTRWANLAFQESHGEAASVQRQRREAAQAMEAAERSLAARSLEFREWQQRRDIGLDAIRRNMPADGALIAYSVYRRPQRRGAWMDTTRELAAFVLTATGPPRLVALGPMHPVDSLVASWGFEAAVGVGVKGRSDETSEIAYRRAGAALRRAIWDPLQALLQGVSQIFVVSDGSLHMVNLAALPQGAENVVGDGYLADTGKRFHALASGRDLVPGSAARAGRGLLALGGADFDVAAGTDPTVGRGGGRASRLPQSLGAHSLRGGGPCASLDELHFEALPGTAREVHDLATQWMNLEDILVLTGAQASDVAFKSMAPGKRMLHLATHGFFLDGPCLLAQDGTRGIRLRQRSREERVPRTMAALLRSGLALAGANRRDMARPDGEDGILTAEEIASLNLRGVEWAVLSACNTGLGEVRLGEGVLGLRRAFQVAGAQSVIMSLWPVADEPTREWMRALYSARLRDGMGTAAAVHHADVTVLAARRARGESTHPFFWAGFVSTGDWR